jgi:hypothetical protein
LQATIESIRIRIRDGYQAKTEYVIQRMTSGTPARAGLLDCHFGNPAIAPNPHPRNRILVPTIGNPWRVPKGPMFDQTFSRLHQNLTD